MGGAGGIVFEGHSIGGGLYVHGFGECIVLGDDTEHMRIARVRKRVKEIVMRIGELWSRSGWSFIEKRGVRPWRDDTRLRAVGCGGLPH